MLLQAAKDLDIELANSIMLGDKASDAQAGLAAGVGTLLHFGANTQPSPARCIRHLTEVVPLLSSQAARRIADLGP